MDIISLWWSENFYKDKIRLYYSPDYVCEDVDDEEDDGREMIYQYDIIGSEEPDLDIEYRDYIMGGCRYYAKGGKSVFSESVWRERVRKKRFSSTRRMCIIANILYGNRWWDISGHSGH